MAKKVIKKVRKPGSTIDDSARLVKLAAKLKAEPNLKVSDAIKAIGITDRASIRRLRDKYRRSHGGAKTTIVALARADVGKPTTGRTKHVSMALRATGAAKTKRAPKTIGTAQKSRSTSKNKTRSTRLKKVTKPATRTAWTDLSSTVPSYGMMMPPWFSIGLDLSSAALHTQVQLYEQMMRSSPLADVVRQQAGLLNAMMGMFTPVKRATTSKPGSIKRL